MEQHYRRRGSLSSHDEQLLDDAGFTVDPAKAEATQAASSLRMQELVGDTSLSALPHLELVLSRIPVGMHPVAVHNLLTLPNPNLTVDDEPASIARFLSATAGSADDLAAVEDAVTAVLWESA